MPIKYFIRKYQGKYEAYLLAQLKGSRRSKSASVYLERFFGHFPTAKGLEQFLVTDVYEYLAWRKGGDEFPTPMQLYRELLCLRNFWKFCIERCNLHLYNPFEAYLEEKPKPKNVIRRKIRLEDFRRILSEIDKLYPDCYGDLLKDWMFSVAFMQERPMYHSRMKLAKMLKKIGANIGLDLNIPKLRPALRNGLWSEIIRIHYKELRDSFFKKSELVRHSPANVEVPPKDEWPSIINVDDYSGVVLGVY